MYDENCVAWSMYVDFPSHQYPLNHKEYDHVKNDFDCFGRADKQSKYLEIFPLCSVFSLSAWLKLINTSARPYQNLSLEKIFISDCVLGLLSCCLLRLRRTLHKIVRPYHFFSSDFCLLESSLCCWVTFTNKLTCMRRSS